MVSSRLRCVILGAVVASASATTLRIGGHVQDAYKKPFELFASWAASQNGSYNVTSTIKTYNENELAADILNMTTDGNATYVDVVVCPYTSSAIKACVDAVNKNFKGPVFAWGGASEAIFDTNCLALPNKNCFGGFTVGSQYMKGGLEALAGAASTVATIVNSNSFSASVAAGANATVAAQSMLTQQSYTQLSVAKSALHAADVSAIKAALAMKPDIVVIAGHNKDVEPVIVQIGKSSHMPKAILATNGLNMMENYGNDAKYANCIMMPTQWDFTAPTKDTVVGWDSSAFSAAMGGSATYQQATAGGIVVALANAMKLANSDVTKLIATLANMDVDSFYGKLKWDSAGRIMKPMYTQQRQDTNMTIVKAPASSPHLREDLFSLFLELLQLPYPLSHPTCWGTEAGQAIGLVASGVVATALSWFTLISLILVQLVD